MKIAVIAFGSLVNDSRDLQVESDSPVNRTTIQGMNIKPDSQFSPAEGLKLPIRLGRKSGGDSENRRITMVLYPGASEEPVYYAKHKFENLDKAIKNLREREGIPESNKENIAFIKADETYRSRHPEIAKKIQQWMISKGFQAAIWTDLPSNIHFPRNSTGREIQGLLQNDAVLLENTKKYIEQLPNPRNQLQKDIMSMRA